MADILTNEQEKELAEIRAFAEGKAGIFMNTSHMAILLLKYADLQTEKLRHVQAENERLKRPEASWLREFNHAYSALVEVSGRYVGLEKMYSYANEMLLFFREREGWSGDFFVSSESAQKLQQENARLRETLGHLHNRIDDPTYTVEEHKAYIGQALATEGEGNG